MLLEVLDYHGPHRWRWRLVSSGGEFLADHQVSLDTGDWQYEAFTDLHRYLRQNTAPDRRLAHMADLSSRVGDWIAAKVLGPIGPQLASSRGHVRLEIPVAASELAYRPWELARLDGQTLAERRVGFIVDQPHPAVAKAPIGERLRMLAVFSLPEDAGALNLRKERFALARLVHDVAAVNNKAIELRVLQYGATRERLEAALLEDPGWDIVHISGHGLPAGLILEDDAGSRDLITSTDLVSLLDLGGDHIKLITLSACESAAVTAAEHLRQIGLISDAPVADEPAESLPAVATELVRRLDCAVLAMRYPVMDDFAIDLAASFYDLVLGKGKPIAPALALALPKAANSVISLATPTLFGARAADLQLPPPPGGPLVLDVAEQRKLARFPAQPDRFVGRVGPMTRATTALAPRSGQSGVLFHGMAGAGKTACALELAYVHQDSFLLMAWYAAPSEGRDIRTALTDFALALEQQLPGLKLAHLVPDAEAFRQFLPTLTEILEQNRVLVVLDNIESLLAENGDWRDERWQWLIGAMMGHRGLSRLVLTSRLRPSVAGVAVEPVHALSLGESVLLAREWPNLRVLIDTNPALASRTLSVVQGHPKLIELADGLAADPENLAKRLDDADETWQVRGTRLDQFLSGGESAATSEDYLSVLDGWTRTIVRSLPENAGILFQLLCCMEANDREQSIVPEIWPQIWGELNQAGPAPAFATTLPVLVDCALVDAKDGGYRIHPGVAESGRGTATQEFAAAVDTYFGGYWSNTIVVAIEQEHEQQLTWLIRRAAYSAAPYLVRQRQWQLLASHIQEAIQRDGSEAVAVAFLPFLEVAVETVRDTDSELQIRAVHARALLTVAPNQAGPLLQEILDAAVAAGELDVAATAISQLVQVHQGAGRLAEAQAVLDAYAEYRLHPAAGPWTRLQDEVRQLQVLHTLGRNREVLDSAQRLRTRMSELPDETANEWIAPWSVRENLLSLAGSAAGELGEWELSLEFTAVVLESQQRRGASLVQQARSAFNNYIALLRLGRIDETRDLLRWCRTVMEEAQEVSCLGMVLGAQAELEGIVGHYERAVESAVAGLRFNYRYGTTEQIMTNHGQLGNHLARLDGYGGYAWAQWCASAIIQYQVGGDLTRHLVILGQAQRVRLPAEGRSFEFVCSMVDHLDGVQFAQLVGRLPRRAPDGQSALNEILRLAEESGAGS